MIMIDIFVPSLYEAFDFEINEKATLEEVLKFLPVIIEKKCGVKFDTPPVTLFSYRKGELIKKNISLSKQGILNGDRLILI